MKNKMLQIIMLAALAANTAFSATINWKGNSTTSGTSLGNALWDGTTSTPTAADDVVIDQTFIESLSRNLVDGFWGGDTTYNSLTLNYTTADKKLNCSSGKAFKLTIANDIVKTGNGTVRFAMGAANSQVSLDVGGNIIVGVDKDTKGGMLVLGAGEPNTTTNWGGPLENVKVAGDVIVYNQSTLVFNVYSKAGTSTLANPDVFIGGVLNAAGSGSPDYKNPSFNLRGVDPTKQTANTNSIISMEGMIGNGVLRGCDNTTAGTYTSNVTVYFRGETATTYTFDGWTHDTTTFSDSTKLKFVKDGQSTQRLMGGQLMFSGGIEMRGGTLQVNGKATGNTTSHGDLTMYGGTFAFGVAKAENKGKESFAFTNLIYDDGTILLNVVETSIDQILLDGTISAMTAGSKNVLKIELGGNDWTYLTQDFRKIIGLGGETEYIESDFTITNLDTDKYSAAFDVRTDGVYLKISEVPEPAALCGIFGALALALAAYRRRK